MDKLDRVEEMIMRIVKAKLMRKIVRWRCCYLSSLSEKKIAKNPPLT